jgi:hypothetical protein
MIKRLLQAYSGIVMLNYMQHNVAAAAATDAPAAASA